ncbi:helix-turn-helix transcriptional regulator [Enterococcus casseliflavus]|uniref:helix-turn-helix domain-containing protein n=1 Tax=Enterococcus casseliflavus TaxID=37734 RepID=UPI00232A7C74|nr:helix-turn-helix transcriptional regulator [Enterococcus casseliflavus]MDB1710538.1 helix-turn-helix transcriptional regulator [Enterococcus casseliflavus]
MLNSIRMDKQLSISELARRVGMAKSAISRYFNKTREFPLNRVEDFAKALGVSSEFILGFEESQQPSTIESIYNDLDFIRKERVFKFAEAQLKEQKKEAFTIAAHSDDPNRKLTKKEFDDLNLYLDEADKKFDDK